MKQRLGEVFLFPPPPPLNDIETIPWPKIQAANGTAEQVPRLLHQLLSSDAQTRKQALTELDFALMSTYASEAAISVVPFLLRLLLEPTVQTKAGVLELLQLIAWPVPRSMNQDLMIAKAARSKTAAGLPIYLMLLADADPTVRLWAGSILICFPEQARAIRPMLSAAFRQEDDPQARANLVEALATISFPKRWQWFLHLSRTEKQDLVVFTALSVIPPLAHEDTPVAVIEQLAAYLIHPLSSLEAFAPPSYIRSTCLRSLFHLKKERLQFLLPWLIGQCEYPARENDHISYPEMLLNLLFAEGMNQQKVADLTEQQKATLFLLSRREDLWKSRNMILLLRSYGLPEKREELIAYLEEL